METTNATEGKEKTVGNLLNPLQITDDVVEQHTETKTPSISHKNEFTTNASVNNTDSGKLNNLIHQFQVPRWKRIHFK